MNGQLGEDLKVCERHLDNVVRTNKAMTGEINCYKDTTLKAIAKLKEPLGKRTSGELGVSERWKCEAEWETGDFERAECK